MMNIVMSGEMKCGVLQYSAVECSAVNYRV